MPLGGTSGSVGRGSKGGGAEKAACAAVRKGRQLLSQEIRFSVAQWAGLAALRSAASDVERMRKIYDERRRFLIRRLRELGFVLKVEPEGAFYIFLNVRHLSQNSYALAFDILEKAGVGVTPGIDFGENAEGYIRISYANSIENIMEGLDRIEGYLRSR